MVIPAWAVGCTQRNPGDFALSNGSHDPGTLLCLISGGKSVMLCVFQE